MATVVQSSNDNGQETDSATKIDTLLMPPPPPKRTKTISPDFQCGSRTAYCTNDMTNGEKDTQQHTIFNSIVSVMKPMLVPKIPNNGIDVTWKKSDGVSSDLYKKEEKHEGSSSSSSSCGTTNPSNSDQHSSNEVGENSNLSQTMDPLEVEKNRQNKCNSPDKKSTCNDDSEEGREGKDCGSSHSSRNTQLPTQSEGYWSIQPTASSATIKRNEDIICATTFDKKSPCGSSVSSTTSYTDNTSNRPLIKTRFSDIIGHGAAKLRLDEMLLPLALPIELAQSVLTGIRATPASILLYGPPGCGKTQLARAAAGEAQAAFLNIGPSDILSKFVGESEASVKALFDEARSLARDMESKCAVVFLDEIDALGLSREGNSSSGVCNGSGSDGSTGETSSRRILAELLIQLTKLSREDDCDNSLEIDEIGDCVAMENDQIEHFQISSSDDNEKINENSEIPSNNGDLEQLDTRSLSPSIISSSSSFGSTCSTGTGEFHSQQHSSKRPEATRNKRSKDSQMTNIRIIVIAATNRPQDCDPALLRRFSIRILVGLPSCRDRNKLLQKLLSDIPHTLSRLDLHDLAMITDGWSGSDLEAMTREAVMAPVRECLRRAAKLKRKSQKNLGEEQVDSVELARNELLNGFQQLRPVTLQDFQDAISFWMGDTELGYGNIHCRSNQTHYNSDSDDEEDAFVNSKEFASASR